MWVETEPGQVTVGFGCYHAHFCAYSGEPDETIFERALKFVDDFISERLMLVIALRGEMVGVSWVQSPLESPSALLQSTKTVSKTEVLRCQSWKSTLDRDVPV